MTLSELDAVFSRDGGDLVWLALSGGEVTCYDDFIAVLALAKRRCRNLRLVTFTTNGLLPGRALAYARAIRAAGFDSFITVSLDGDAQIHDRLRGVPGSHDSAWHTYDLLRSDGITVHFGITLSEDNVAFIERHYHDLSPRIKAVTILHDRGIYAQTNSIDDDAIGRALDVIVSEYRIASVGQLVEKCYLRLAREFVRSGRTRNMIPCAVGRAALHIRPDGATLLCMFMPELGNVRLGSKLRDLVNSQRAAELLTHVDAGRCPHCWMNCYAPHSIFLNPARTIAQSLRSMSSRKRENSQFSHRPPHPHSCQHGIVSTANLDTDKKGAGTEARRAS